jgi:signal transduction histidine kinase
VIRHAAYLGPRVLLSRVTRYALAVAIAGVATLVRLAVDPLIGDQIPYFIYVGAVVVATWFCGVEGGFLSAFVAGFVGDYLFVPPRYEVLPHGQDWIALSLFWAVCACLVVLVGRWRRADIALREMTQRLRALHAEAERANQLKDEFLATLSHELRTPLNAIVGWSHIVRSGKLDPEKLPPALEAIDRNARTLTQLVNDVLDVSRIITGRLRLDVQVLDPAQCVHAAVEALQPAAEAKHLIVQTTIAPHGKVVADPLRLQQIVWNLVSNAVKFTPRGGRIDVTVGARASALVIEVSDNGPGIKPDFLPHLFQRFSQQDGSTTRRHGGLGLGLAIVRHLAELHGGSVDARSEGEGQGATFTVVIPTRAVAAGEPDRVADGQPGAPARVASLPLLAGVRILTVDDEPDARTLVATTLQAFGAEVRTADSAEEALEFLRDWRPAILVADIGMPDRDGYWLIREVRRLSSAEGGRTLAVALTAYARPEDCQRAVEAGYDEYLSKPVPANELGATLVRLVATTF